MVRGGRSAAVFTLTEVAATLVGFLVNTTFAKIRPLFTLFLPLVTGLVFIAAIPLLTTLRSVWRPEPFLLPLTLGTRAKALLALCFYFFV